IAVKVEVAVRFHRPPYRLAGAMVILLGSTDETIIRYVELVEPLTEISGHFICQVAWSSPQLTGLLRHLQPVFVSSGLEAHFAAAEPLKAGQYVRGDRLIGMANVRPPVGIVDRGDRKSTRLNSSHVKISY